MYVQQFNLAVRGTHTSEREPILKYNVHLIQDINKMHA